MNVGRVLSLPLLDRDEHLGAVRALRERVAEAAALGARRLDERGERVASTVSWRAVSVAMT